MLSEINPTQADTIISRGLMYGESRVICGAHWQSDVDAGRIAASVAYAKLHTSERFLKQMAAAKKEFSDLIDRYPPSDRGLSNDSVYNEFRKEVANLEYMERSFHCRILKYPFGFDETTGLKMLFIKTNDSPYNVSNGVDYVVLTNDKNEIVYVVLSVLRHDGDVDDGERLYGLYVLGKEMEGEIEIPYRDILSIEQLILQMGKSPEFQNCTKIKFRVAAVPHLIPFSPISNKDGEEYRRFFRN